jgi:hypothetical protein
MTQHTPGPWYTDDFGDDDIYRYVVTDVYDHPYIVARLALCGEVKNETVEANTRLIAAAPDLLLALKEIVSQIDQGGDDGKVFGRDACITMARKAIDKYKGGAA